MKTRLREFCGELAAIVGPLAKPLDDLIRDLGALAEAGAEAAPGEGELAALRDARHRLGTLVQKMTEQQAYVLIFGPLKSGKSTLMNALTAAYVSEVTALPAYPCMVHVAHAEEPAFTVVRYDGTTEAVRDGEALHRLVSDAHHRLSQHIRAVEARETVEAFDPHLHYPQAIRKVEVRLPAGDLEASGAVLVDTPGLYSRMKFGYDQMTRDFRDTAACAVFVVKAENLFLEQVFEEFHQLVELFGRTYLVVNVDGSKRDLQADGTLAPSLEVENPQAIIEAFETLAMSAPLKDALDAGRLRIYAVDLLQAAAQRLKGRGGPGRRRARHDTGFTPFHGDLTQYLGSIEYLDAYVSDAIRYAQRLAADLAAVVRGGRVPLLEGERDAASAHRERLARRTADLKQLADLKWQKVLAPDLARWKAQTARFAADERARIRDNLGHRVAGWLRDGRSLAALYHDEFALLAEQTAVDMARGSARELDARVTHMVSAAHGGFTPDPSLAVVLAACGLDMAAMVREHLQAHPVPERLAVAPPAFAWEVAAIPVRRRLLDWLALRTGAEMRDSLLGTHDGLRRHIEPADKARHLGRRGGVALEAQMWAPLKAVVDDVEARLAGALDQLVSGVAEAVTARVNADFAAARHALEAVEGRLRAVRAGLTDCGRVDALLVSMAGELETLAGRFAIESLVSEEGT